MKIDSIWHPSCLIIDRHFILAYLRNICSWKFEEETLLRKNQYQDFHYRIFPYHQEAYATDESTYFGKTVFKISQRWGKKQNLKGNKSIDSAYHVVNTHLTTLSTCWSYNDGLISKLFLSMFFQCWQNLDSTYVKQVSATIMLVWNSYSLNHSQMKKTYPHVKVSFHTLKLNRRVEKRPFENGNWTAVAFTLGRYPTS